MDFSDYPRNRKFYGGANGLKNCIIINGDAFLLKTIPLHDQNHTRYDAFSEYVSSHVFELLGVDVQDTIFGFNNLNGNLEYAVACKDFIPNNCELYEFDKFRNSKILGNSKHQSLDQTLYLIDHIDIIDPILVKDRFWTQFAVDAFIGNWDRHNGNWGFIIPNDENANVSLAPVFDNGSSLFGRITDQNLHEYCKQNRIPEICLGVSSSLTDNFGKMLNYVDFISTTNHKECIDKIEWLVDSIDLNKVDDIIYSVDEIPEIRKDFISEMLGVKKELILKDCLIENKSKIRSTSFNNLKELNKFKLKNNKNEVNSYDDLYRKHYLKALNYSLSKEDLLNKFDTEFVCVLYENKVNKKIVRDTLIKCSPFYEKASDPERYLNRVQSQAGTTSRNKDPFTNLRTREELENDLAKLKAVRKR